MDHPESSVELEEDVEAPEDAALIGRDALLGETANPVNSNGNGTDSDTESDLRIISANSSGDGDISAFVTCHQSPSSFNKSNDFENLESNNASLTASEEDPALNVVGIKEDLEFDVPTVVTEPSNTTDCNDLACGETFEDRDNTDDRDCLDAQTDDCSNKEGDSGVNLGNVEDSGMEGKTGGEEGEDSSGTSGSDGNEDKVVGEEEPGENAGTDVDNNESSNNEDEVPTGSQASSNRTRRSPSAERNTKQSKIEVPVINNCHCQCSNNANLQAQLQVMQGTIVNFMEAVFAKFDHLTNRVDEVGLREETQVTPQGSANGSARQSEVVPTNDNKPSEENETVNQAKATPPRTDNEVVRQSEVVPTNENEGQCVSVTTRGRSKKDAQDTGSGVNQIVPKSQIPGVIRTAEIETQTDPEVTIANERNCRMRIKLSADLVGTSNKASTSRSNSCSNEGSTEPANVNLPKIERRGRPRKTPLGSVGSSNKETPVNLRKKETRGRPRKTSSDNVNVGPSEKRIITPTSRLVNLGDGPSNKDQRGSRPRKSPVGDAIVVPPFKQVTSPINSRPSQGSLNPPTKRTRGRPRKLALDPSPLKKIASVKGRLSKMRRAGSHLSGTSPKTASPVLGSPTRRSIRKVPFTSPKTVETGAKRKIPDGNDAKEEQGKKRRRTITAIASTSKLSHFRPSQSSTPITAPTSTPKKAKNKNTSIASTIPVSSVSIALEILSSNSPSTTRPNSSAKKASRRRRPSRASGKVVVKKRIPVVGRRNATKKSPGVKSPKTRSLASTIQAQGNKYKCNAKRILKKKAERLAAGKELLVCDYCDRDFTTATGKAVHTKSKHLGQKWNCGVCGDVCNYPAACTRCRHNKERSRSISKTPPKNSAGGSGSSASKRNERKPYRCKYCGEWFDTIHAKFDHTQSVNCDKNRKGKEFKCEVCGTLLSSKMELTAHVKRLHPNVPWEEEEQEEPYADLPPIDGPRAVPVSSSEVENAPVAGPSSSSQLVPLVTPSLKKAPRIRRTRKLLAIEEAAPTVDEPSRCEGSPPLSKSPLPQPEVIDLTLELEGSIPTVPVPSPDRVETPARVEVDIATLRFP